MKTKKEKLINATGLGKAIIDSMSSLGYSVIDSGPLSIRYHGYQEGQLHIGIRCDIKIDSTGTKVQKKAEGN